MYSLKPELFLVRNVVFNIYIEKKYCKRRLLIKFLHIHIGNNDGNYTDRAKSVFMDNTLKPLFMFSLARFVLENSVRHGGETTNAIKEDLKNIYLFFLSIFMI